MPLTRTRDLQDVTIHAFFFFFVVGRHFVKKAAQSTTESAEKRDAISWKRGNREFHFPKMGNLANYEQTRLLILMNSTLITSTDRLLASGLLSLSVLNFTTHYKNKNDWLRKSGFARLLGDFVLLFSSLLDISKAHTSNRSLDLVGLLASTLALFSSLWIINQLAGITSVFLLLRLQATVHRIRAGFFFWFIKEQVFLER